MRLFILSQCRHKRLYSKMSSASSILFDSLYSSYGSPSYRSSHSSVYDSSPPYTSKYIGTSSSSHHHGGGGPTGGATSSYSSLYSSSYGGSTPSSSSSRYPSYSSSSSYDKYYGSYLEDLSNVNRSGTSGYGSGSSSSSHSRPLITASYKPRHLMMSDLIGEHLDRDSQNLLFALGLQYFFLVFSS